MSWSVLAGRYGKGVARHRGRFLIAAAILSAMATLVAPSIETTADPTAYLPRERPEVARWMDLNARFGALDLLLVGIEEPEEPLSLVGLEHLADVTRTLEDQKSRGVLTVRSLANVDTLTPDETGTLHAERLVPSLPATKAEQDALARRILADTQVPGSLVSRDLRAYTLLIRPDPRRDSREVARVVEEVVEAHRGPLTAVFFGGPFIANLVTRKVHDRLPWLVPLFAGLLLCVLAAGTWRSGVGARARALVFAIVLGGAGLSLVWWLGLLRVFGFSLTLNDVNGLLLVLVSATLLYARWADARWSGARVPPEPAVAFAATCGLALVALHVAGPHLPAPLSFLGRMGVLLALGFAAALGLGFLGVWPLLTFVAPAPGPGVPPSHGRHGVARFLLPIAVIVTAIAAVQVRFVSGLRDLFTRSDPVGQTLDFFDRHFGGSDFIQVSARGDLRDPSVLARVHRLTDLLEGAMDPSGARNVAFSDVRSITQVVGFLAQNFSGAYRVPDDRESLNNLWFFLEGNDDVRSLVTPDRDEAMLALRVPPNRDISSLLTIVEAAIRDSLDTGVSGAVRRLDALARRFQVDLPPGRSAGFLADVSASSRGFPHDSALAELRREMESPESPFVPTDEEWAIIAGVLGSNPPDGVDLALLERVIRSLPSYQALDAPEDLAGRVAAMIRERARALDAEVRSREAAERWLAQVDSPPEALMVRARGVIHDLLAGPRAPGQSVRFQVTGYPVLLPAIERDLLHGMFRAVLGVVLAVFAAGWLASRRVRPPPGLLLEAMLAAALPTGIAWAVGLQVDSGSATMLLAGPIAVGLLFPGPSGASRLSALFALALAAASSSLAVTGVLPVTRIGVVLGVALATAGVLSFRPAHDLCQSRQRESE